jgi:hypothetical protein
MQSGTSRVYVGPIRRPRNVVTNDQQTLLNIPEERRLQELDCLILTMKALGFFDDCLILTMEVLDPSTTA